MAYSDSSQHYRSPYLRPLPHYRTYFPAIAQSSNCFVKSPTLCPRRIAFLLIALMRTVQTGWYLFGAIMGLAKSTAIWILVIICLAAFTLELWNLHLIVEAEGEGSVCGRRVPGGVFSLIMFWITVWHVWMVPLEISGLAFYGGAGATLIVEGISIALICVVAWVANMEPIDQGLSLAL